MKIKLVFVSICLANSLFAQNIVFRTVVENLRLRESPNLESEVIKTLPKGERLAWLKIRSEKKEMLDWKGRKTTDYWYKIKTASDTTAWVFGQGIILDGLYLGTYDEKDSINYKIDNEWIKIEKSSEKIFSSIPITIVQWIDAPSKKENEGSLKGKPFTLSFKNGKKITYNEFENEEREYIGELPEQGFYIIEGGICCSVYSAICKSNGKMIEYFEMPLFSKKNTPIFSADKKTFVSNYGCEPGGEDGISFSQISGNEIIKISKINLFPVRDFRFITNRSGIAKLPNGEFWKIILK